MVISQLSLKSQSSQSSMPKRVRGKKGQARRKTMSLLSDTHSASPWSKHPNLTTSVLPREAWS